jgi:hypothetical protein
MTKIDHPVYIYHDSGNCNVCEMLDNSQHSTQLISNIQSFMLKEPGCDTDCSHMVWCNFKVFAVVKCNKHNTLCSVSLLKLQVMHFASLFNLLHEFENKLNIFECNSLFKNTFTLILFCNFQTVRECCFGFR